MSSSIATNPLRRLGYTLAAAVVGYYAGFAWWALASGPVVGGAPRLSPVKVEPNPQLAPADVVRLQVEALRADGAGRVDVAQCFALASPANRLTTGPLARFAAMIEAPAYRPLMTHRIALFGTPVVHGDVATALVTVADPGLPTVAYRFYLSKQQESPYDDCWMTDAVIRTAANEPDDPHHLPI